MKKITLDEIYNFKVDIKNAKLSNNKRGLNVVFDPCYIDETTDYLYDYLSKNAPTDLFNKTYVEYSNFRTMTKETLDAIAKSPWWVDDYSLLKKYIDLWKQINNIANNYKNNKESKNNIAYQKECCYSGFIISNDILQVQCRSSDMYFGIRSDIIIFTLLAKELGCKRIIIIMHQPHYYLNTTKVNRRK